MSEEGKKGGRFEMKDVKRVYDFVKSKSEGMDAIYEDYIVELVGIMGLNALMKHRLIETCGVVNGRQLYTLMSKN